MSANPTPSDPVIEEVREARRRISARFDHDPTRLVAYYLELQQQYQHRMLDVAQLPTKVGESAA